MTESSLARKIKALMAKTTAAGCTEEEAMSAAAKVQKLLIENNLAMSDLKDTTVERGAVGAVFHADKWNSPSRKILLGVICRFYMCEVLIYKHTKQMQFIGRPHNVAVAVEMADYLIKTVVRLSNTYARDTGGKAIDFRKGAMMRLAARLEKMRKEQEKPTVSTGSELVLFKSENALVEELKNKIGFTTARKSRIRANLTDAAAGAAAANTISLHKQVRGIT